MSSALAGIVDPPERDGIKHLQSTTGGGAGTLQLPENAIRGAVGRQYGRVSASHLSRPRYFLVSCDRSLRVLPNLRLRNQRQEEQGLSNIVVRGTSLFLRGIRFLADFGHSVSCIAFRLRRRKKIRTSQRTRGCNGTPDLQGRAALSREIAEQLTGFGFYGCR